MSQDAIHYESRDGIATLTIDRPRKRNALTADMCEQLRAALVRLHEGEDRVGILCARGDVFCAGADLAAPPSQFWRAVPEVGVAGPKPLIAAVQGPVVGLGLALVTFCDLCIAAQDTRFIYPEARVGVAKGLISALAGRVPHKIAMELMLTGGPVDAQRAFDVGFVNRVVPAGTQIEAAQEMARGLAASAPLVLAQLKALARATLPVSPAQTLYQTQDLIDQAMNSEDAREGLRAFTEKRPPRFTGR